MAAGPRRLVRIAQGMKTILITVGDELLIGQVVNTNAAWLGEQMNLAGAEVVAGVTLPDDVDSLTEALGRATEQADLVVVTGGLGPTHDDVTRDALARYVGVPLQLDENVLQAIRSRFESRGSTMPERNSVQALVPAGFEVLANPVGTAPGLWYESIRGSRTVILAVLPGVPHEMRYLANHELVPRLRRVAGLRTIRHRTLLTAGIGESLLQERIGDLSGFLSGDTRLAYLPNPGGVRLRITAVGHAEAETVERLEAFERHLRMRIGRFVYGTDSDTIEQVVGRLLADRGHRIAVAESCTGGNLLHRLTNVPGASTYLVGGVVAYDNAVKRSLLGVDPVALEEEGAVSEAVACQMAQGIRRVLGADIGISTTGIAGPAGGTPEKPVGTVWIGYADHARVEAVRLQFGDDRELNKERASTAAMDFIRRYELAAAPSP